MKPLKNLVVGVALTTAATFAYPELSLAQSASGPLAGTWVMTSADAVRPDGSRSDAFGTSPKGMMTFSSDGYFTLIQMRSDLPRIAANGRDQGSADENKAIVGGSIAYFGTYTFSEADKTMTLKLEGSTFPNLLSLGEQKRLVTLLTTNELRFTNPRTPSGMTLEVAWKRAP